MVDDQRQLRKDGNGKKSVEYFITCVPKIQKMSLDPFYLEQISSSFVWITFSININSALKMFFFFGGGVCVLAVSFPSPGNVKQR